MVRHARAAQYEDVPRPVVAVGNDYPSNHAHPMHQHRRAQLLHAIAGTMVVTTEQGCWVVPPQQGFWIPSGVRHEFSMIGNVITRSVYVEPEAAQGMPAQCRVLELSALLCRLLIEAVDVPVAYEEGSRAAAIMNLLLLELRAAPTHALAVPFPTDVKLAALCRGFLRQPSAHAAIDDWAQELAMSRRAFTRAFRRETGLSFAEWRRQAAVLQAVERIAGGEAITTIAPRSRLWQLGCLQQHVPARPRRAAKAIRDAGARARRSRRMTGAPKPPYRTLCGRRASLSYIKFVSEGAAMYHEL
jgi:AraC-like DNA-binding protein/mannose-6-phosphate isomerase-like protein (cupin superfamily)